MEVRSSTALAKYSALVSVIPALYPNNLYNIKHNNGLMNSYMVIKAGQECLNYSGKMECTGESPLNSLAQGNRKMGVHCGSEVRNFACGSLYDQ